MQVQSQSETLAQALRWAGFLQKTALTMGSLLLASSVISWIAANWAYASTFQKLTGTQALLVLLTLFTVWLLYNKPYQQPNFSAPALAAGLAAVCLGGLLALVGQIYQTGADPWQLFLLWAVLLLPWLLSVHTVFIGLLVVILLNTAASLYVDVIDFDFFSQPDSIWGHLVTLLLPLNLLLLLIWESAMRYLHDTWRLGPRLLWFITVTSMVATLDYPLASLFFLIILAGVGWFYSQRRRDLVMLAITGQGILGIIAIQLIQRIDDDLGLLFVVTAMVGLNVWMLRYLRRWSKAQASTQNDSNDPWLISWFRISAMVFATISVLLFLYLTIGFDLDDLWLVGLGLILLVRLVMRVPRPEVSHEIADILTSAGMFMLGTGIYAMPEVNPYLRLAGLIVVAVWVYISRPGFVVRWVTAMVTLVAILLLTWPEELWDLPVLVDHRNLGFPEALLFAVYVRLWLLSVLALLAIVLSQKKLIWLPLGWALVILAQIGALLTPTTGMHALAWLPMYHVSNTYPFALMFWACAMLPLITLVVLLWPVKTLPLAVRVGAPFILAVACQAWIGSPGITLGLLWLIVGFAQKRNALLFVGAFAILAFLGIYYQQMQVSLLYKSFLLGATGVWLLASYWVLSRVVKAGNKADKTQENTQEANENKANSGLPWRAGGFLAGLLLMLVVVNTGIFQREQIVSHGHTLVLELAPVDPRSLMQGDYMALRFAAATQLYAWVHSETDPLSQQIQDQGHGYLVLTPDAAGVHQILGVQAQQNGPRVAISKADQNASQGNRLQPELLLEFRIRHGGIRLVTDAWFFPEGQGQHFAQAQYGQLKVSDQGVGLLVRMLDKNKQAL